MADLFTADESGGHVAGEVALAGVSKRVVVLLVFMFEPLDEVRQTERRCKCVTNLPFGNLAYG